MNGKQFASALVLALALAIGWWYRPVPQSGAWTGDEHERREAFAESVHLRVMDEGGRPVYDLRATGMDYYRNEDNLVLEQPRLSLVHDDGSRWELHADHGQGGMHSDIVQLTGNVDIRRLASKHHKALEISTSNIRVETGSGLATTDASARISGEGYQVEAIGMEADLKNHRLELGSQVRGRFDAAG